MSSFSLKPGCSAGFVGVVFVILIRRCANIGSVLYISRVPAITPDVALARLVDRGGRDAGVTTNIEIISILTVADPLPIFRG